MTISMVIVKLALIVISMLITVDHMFMFVVLVPNFPDIALAQNFKLVTYFGIIGHSLNLDIVLGFIPKPDNSKRAAGTFGLFKEEKTSNMVHNWPAWARGIFTLNGSKIELSKYTYSSIEKGLYVAAYRICWFLTEGLENILPTLVHQVSNMMEAKYS